MSTPLKNGAAGCPSDALVQSAAKQFDTPFYLYDIRLIEQQITRLRTALNGHFDVALSLKANPNPNLLKCVHSSVDYLDVASSGEIALARMAGVKPDRLIFVGPGKSLAELKTACELGIACVVAESLDELRALAKISEDLGIKTSVALRVNPNFFNQASGMSMGGSACQFGVDEEQALEVIRMAQQFHSLDFIGLHYYLGTQFLDASKLLKNFEYIFHLSLRLQQALEQTFKWIDFGGGFGVPYFEGEKPLDMDGLRQGLANLVKCYRNQLDTPTQQKLVVESGRYLFAGSGVYCARVLYKKQSKGKVFCILDGGSNFNGSLCGMGRMLRKNFPHRIISSQEKLSLDQVEHVDEVYNLVGPLCLPSDQLAIEVKGIAPDIGDVVAFEKAGAYGLSYSQVNFLSHLNIRELGYNGKSLFYLKKPKTEEMLRQEYNLSSTSFTHEDSVNTESIACSPL